MNRNPHRRSIVITGSSSGVGKACAVRLAKAGWEVFGGVRSERDADQLREFGLPNLTPVPLDVTDTASLQQAVEQVEAHVQGDGLTALVNNSAVSITGPIEFQPLESFRAMLDVNLVGVLATTQAFLPMLRKQAGRIVTIGTVAAGGQAVPLFGGYVATKFALLGLVQTLRFELAPWGLSATIVDPGFTRTPMWDKLEASLEDNRTSLPPDGVELYGPLIRGMIPLTRCAARLAAKPETVAKVVERALAARRPRLRYPVGVDSHLAKVVTGIVPSGVRNFILRRVLELAGRRLTPTYAQSDPGPTLARPEH